MAGTGVGKFSSTAGSNTSNLTVNFAENMAPSNVNNAARELMGHIRDMYEQLGDGYFEFGDGDGEYTVARSDADTITITSSSDISSVYFAGRKIRITDGGANVVEGTIASSSHTSTTQTVNLTGISLASGTPTKVELGVDTAAFGGRIILDDDGDTYIEAPTDDTIDIYVAGAKDFVITANTFTAESGSTIAAQALTATTVTASGIVKTDDTTNATSTTDGSLQTDGGLSVALDAVIGDDLFMKSDASVIHFGADSEVTMTHVADAGLAISSAGNLDTLSLISTDADGDFGPNLRFYRNSSTPADADNLALLDFEGRNDNSQDVVYGQIMATTEDVSDGTEDGAMNFRVMKDGTSREHIRMSGSGGVVINEASLDIDFRVESDGNANMFVVDAGLNRVAIGTNDPDKNLHLQSAGATEMRIENSSDNVQMDVQALTGSASIRTVGSHPFTLQTAQTEGFRVDINQKLMTNGETAGDTGEGGLCLNQAANDDGIITAKSSDVGHPFTNIAQADTFYRIKKFDTNGGVEMDGYRAGNCAMEFNAYCSTESDTKTVNATAAMRFNTALTNGSTGATAISSNDNLCAWFNDGAAKMILDAEGDLFTDGTKDATFDTYEDAQLVRAYDLSHGQGVINSTFDKYVKYNHESLAEAGLVGREADGTPNHFINVTGFQRLHNGAIWQQYEKTERLANAMYELAKAAVGEEKANEILEQNEIKLLN